MSDSVREVRDGVNDLTQDEHCLMANIHDGVDGTVNGLRIGDVSLVYVAYGTTVEVISPPSGRRLLIVMPLGPMGVECGENLWLADAPFALHSERATRMVPDGPHGCLIAAVDAGTLEFQLTTMYGKDLARPLLLSGETPLRLVAPGLVTSTWLGVVSQVEASGCAPVDPLLERGLSSMLVTSILTGLSPHVENVLEPGTKSIGPEYVHAALEFLREHYRENVSVEQAATWAGISLRQLEAAFQEHLDATPVQLLRDIRLGAARRVLEQSQPALPVTVASVAAEVGFLHLGRFSAYYAQKYQESPSTTLKRIRSRA
ncbi:MAG: AraC family transcriptional regulator [Microbacteriaceae bacterium]